MPEGKIHRVVQGDSVESVAAANGHHWQTLWNHPENAKLKQLRQDPHVLYPGDQLFVPDRRPKEEGGATGKRHLFLRKGTPSRFRIVVLEDGEPRANERYILEIDGKLFEGATKADGSVDHPIPAKARSGQLTLSPGQNERIYPLQLGGLDPSTEISGIQGRLRNLGYFVGSVNGKLGPETIAAIEMFQRRNGLPVTGEPDAATRDKLKVMHGS